ncbi:uncharacterized protein N7496_003214 [Penicillium cataractarum]|uniref:SP-RING-type domain-containing protein n=1 Tax=Penicillium cataractarum TaxID=2100454 RepID=A0A9W9VIL7_9EURO|nr:uncharacterized protein N7496_003214 [Penicillium cataractarum]KAJ5380786.1 hypothetical protein N7496_003214 [Penicillium cataractarum]
MLSATPARQRTSLSQSRPPPSVRSRATPRSTARATEIPEGTEGPEVPEYQSPEAPLSKDDYHNLHQLLGKHSLEIVKKHIHDAGVNLTESVGEVSDRLRDAQTRYQKGKEKRRNEEDGQELDGGEDEEYQRLAEQERQVNSIVGRLEEKMRHVVDSEAKSIGLKDALEKLYKEEAQIQTILLPERQLRSRQRPMRRVNDEDGDAEMNEGEMDRESTPVREVRERNTQNPPRKRLDTSLAEDQRNWEALSLTQRYANNNTYTGFYRIMHDSKYPDNEAPPMPHSSTWFSHMDDHDAGSDVGASGGSPSTRRTRNQRQPSPADSDDVAIALERISLDCPLTLVRFRDPVTSTKCPHSFEHDAIMDMISRSRPMPGGPPRVKAVKCPVCSIILTAGDLVRDTALQRRVRRAEEQEARRAEESDEEDEDAQRRLNRVTLASDAVDPDEDAMDVDRPPGTQIKSEPGQIKGKRRMMESDDEDEEEEEEEEGEDETESSGDIEEDSD